MKGNNTEDSRNDIPPFATTSAAASYKVGKEAYIDLLFMRAHFVIDDISESSAIEGHSEIRQQKAELNFSTVSSVTMTAEQARVMIEAVQHQLTELAKE